MLRMIDTTDYKTIVAMHGILKIWENVGRDFTRDHAPVRTLEPASVVQYVNWDTIRLS